MLQRYAYARYITNLNYINSIIFGIWTEQNGDPHAVYTLYDKRTNAMTCYKTLDASSVGMDNWGHPVSSDMPGCLVTYSTEESDDESMSLCVYRLI